MNDVPSPVPDPAPGASPPPISRAIYGMPMFATLLVADLDRTTSWYVDGLGFIKLFTVPGPAGPTLVHLRRWQFQDLLARPSSEPVTPGTGCVLNFAAVTAELDDLASRARDHGGGRVEGPYNTAWNTRDLRTVDSDGNVVVFTAARPFAQSDRAFSERIRRWSVEQDVCGEGP
jgi:catechol 2,3-dioxygenase-like lactoylglutathione lyase family enzyme